MTDFALRATKVKARPLGKAMSTMVVQERHLWLSLAEMKDADKARSLDAPISQVGLFGDIIEGFAQQFSAVQQQTEAIQHILPQRDAPSTAAPGARPQSARHRGRPPASSRAAPPQAESTHRPACRASRRRAAPPASQPGPKSSRKSMRDDIPPRSPLASPVWDPGSSVRMPQNTPPSVPSTPTPFRCTTTGTSIVPPKFNGVLETLVAVRNARLARGDCCPPGK